MGELIEFNWILKISNEQGFPTLVENGKTYQFTKKGNRIFPKRIPINLVNQNWEVIASIQIIEYSNSTDVISGKFRVIRKFSEEEKEVLTKIQRENIEFYKGEKITNFSKFKLT